MKTIKNFLFSATIIVLSGYSCKQHKNDTIANAGGDSQIKEVMAIHDEVMPKMGKIGKLVAELKPMADTITTQGQQYQKAMTDLQDSYTAMMDWMHHFGDRFTHEEIHKGKALSEQKQQWLDEEEEKVKALKEQINGSIERAEALLAVQE